MKTIYWLEELDRNSLAVAGGKGANLGEMVNSGFPVPPAFVVSSGAYFEFVKAAGLEPLIRGEVAVDVQDTAKLQKASARIKQAIVEARMPKETRSEIIRAYNKLCGTELIPSMKDELKVAVRSSATAEDLPEASFAGQQATFTNVSGADGVVKAVQDCWASLFEARAIYYRVQNGFDHMRVGLCAIVQKMVDSEKSGILFTVNPVTEDADAIVIEAVFGLGEAIVSGAVMPDSYIVDKKSLAIRDKDIAKQDIMIVRAPNGGDETVGVPEEMREVQKITDEDIVALAEIGRKIEEHYAAPQDIEWAIEAGKRYIVQSRAITTLGKKKKEVKAMAASDGKALLRGMGASPGVASGPVKIIRDSSEIDLVKKGDVLVAKMTSPDYVPAMKRAAAIVTDAGGMTCHAAIVSRELGVPSIVGTKEATTVLKDGQIITVDAKRGIIYDGEVAIEGATKAGEAQQAAVVAAPAHAVTGTKIYVNVAAPEKAEEVGAKDCDGVGLLRAEFMIAGLGVHPKKLVKEHREQEFIDAVANGLRTVCSAFYPRPVIYRATDFKTNEYRNLEGGAEFEPQEENPMIGYRGCLRYVKDPDVFRMELRAIKKVREEFGMKNLWLMIPFVRTLHELRVCKQLTEEEGLPRTYDFKFGIMCEVPSTVILAEEFCEIGIDFMSIGSNDLTQLTLGVDRDSALVAEDFDERDPSILKSVKAVIEGCHKHGVRVGICGQAPSVYPEFAEALVEYGIDSISVNPDVIDVTRRIVASAEMKALLKKARSA